MASVFKRGGKANRAGYWYCQWYDHHGKRMTCCTKTTDKATAERIAAKMEADTALRRDGVIDPTLDAVTRESQRTIEPHLTDYEAKLRTGGRDGKHVFSTISYIRKICESNEFFNARDLNADGVHRFAGKLRESQKSARIIQAYLTAIKGFSKSLAMNHKLPRDPLLAIHRPNPDTERRRERRMLLPDEWGWIRSSILRDSRDCFGMPTSDRATLYTLAIQTGLRSN